MEVRRIAAMDVRFSTRGKISKPGATHGQHTRLARFGLPGAVMSRCKHAPPTRVWSAGRPGGTYSAGKPAVFSGTNHPTSPRSRSSEPVPTCWFAYLSESGEQHMRRVVYIPGWDGEPEGSRWQVLSPTGGGWKLTDGQALPSTVYGSERLVRARREGTPVTIASSEREVDQISARGGVAVYPPDGKWQDSHHRQLEGVNLLGEVPAVRIEPRDSVGRGRTSG